MRAPILMLATAIVVATACGGDDSPAAPVSKIVKFTATMTPAGEPPGLLGNPTGSGTFSATLDTSTNVFTWTGTFTGLTSNVNNGHIHGPFVLGGAATTAVVILNFNPSITPGATFVGLGSATSGSVSGTVTLNTAYQPSAQVNGDSLRHLLLNGNAYVNIHTVTNGGGEIRGQISKVP
ncbi:MAG TPA: CHRD domain-containing protein [Gemmatimonadaceae bacterium]|nr:CHRD domain-containing protein [Gemmatimonadaceae bacterium]